MGLKANGNSGPEKPGSPWSSAIARGPRKNQTHRRRKPLRETWKEAPLLLVGAICRADVRSGFEGNAAFIERLQHHLPLQGNRLNHSNPVRRFASKQNYNAVLDAMAEFRSVHYGWAQESINRWTDDPRGTGGTPYMKWLKQLIDETLAFKID